MNKQSEFYNLLQPYVELGYYIADLFLVKSKNYVEVVYGEPYYLNSSSYSIYGDLKPDNTGYYEAIKPIPCKRNLMIIDLGGFIEINFNDLESFECSILNYYSELLTDEKSKIFAFSFNFGLKLRLGILGDIIFSNIISKAKIGMFYKCKLKERVSISDANIICCRVIQNYVKNYFNKRGINYKEYANETIYFYDEIKNSNMPTLLTDSLLRYLSEYAIGISFCTNDNKNMFNGLEILHYLSIKKQDYFLTAWILGNQLLAPVSNDTVQLLENRRKRLLSIINLDLKPNADFYGSLWEYQEFNISNNPNAYFKSLRNENSYFAILNKELLKSVLWICQNEHESLLEIIDLLNESSFNSEELFTMADIIIDEVNMITDMEEFIAAHATRHFYKGNYYKSLRLFKKYLDYGGLETPTISKMLSYIYKHFRKDETSIMYKNRYNKGIMKEYIDIEPLCIDPILIWDGNKEKIKLKVDKPFTYKSTKKEDFSQIRRKIILPEHAPHAPIYVGDIIGKVEYYMGKKCIGYTNIVAAECATLDYNATKLRLHKLLNKK